LKLLIATAVAAAAMLIAASAFAAPNRWSKLTLTQKRELVLKAIRTERSHVRWWLANRPRLSALFSDLSPPPTRLLLGLQPCPALGVATTDLVCAAAANVRQDQAVLDGIDAAIAEQNEPPWPTWWLTQAICIHGKEGALTDNTGNSYFGGWQFLRSTWESVGGPYEIAFDHPGDPSYPFTAPAREQLFRAWLVWNRDGGSWREWGTAGACGLA
jgi:hypothetical protein